MNGLGLAYIKGVLDGDGYVDWSNTNPRLCLQTTSEANAKEFYEALMAIGLTPHLTTRSRYHKNVLGKYSFWSHYYVVRATCKPSLIEIIKQHEPTTNKEKVEYIRGFYVSEGSLYIKRYPNRVCYNLTITNRDIDQLTKIQKILKGFGINSTIRCYRKHMPYLQIQNRIGIQKFLQLIGVEKP
jgi:intein-encoded DNA endonuclease-like protein